MYNVHLMLVYPAALIDACPLFNGKLVRAISFYNIFYNFFYHHYITYFILYFFLFSFHIFSSYREASETQIGIKLCIRWENNNKNIP